MTCSGLFGKFAGLHSIYLGVYGENTGVAPSSGAPKNTPGTSRTASGNCPFACSGSPTVISALDASAGR